MLHDDCACSYFWRKSVQWHGIVYWMLGWREHYCNFDKGDKHNETVKFLKKHVAYVNFTSLFSSLCSTVAPKIYNITKTKHNTHICSGCKDKGHKNLSHTSKTRLPKHPKFFKLQLPRSRLGCLLLFQSPKNRTQRNCRSEGCEV